QQQQALNSAARDLRDAANAMRQAAANGSRDGGAQAAAALDKLKQAQKRLQRDQSGRGPRDIQDALRQAKELAEEQKRVEADVDSLDGTSGAGRQSKAQSIAERKDQMD